MPVMVGWKHAMIISRLQKMMTVPMWAIIDEFGVNLSGISFYQNGLHRRIQGGGPGGPDPPFFF